MAIAGEATAPSLAHLLRTREVLAIVQVSDPAFRSWVRLGKFPPPRVRLGRSPMWHRDDVEAFIRGEWKAP